MQWHLFSTLAAKLYSICSSNVLLQKVGLRLHVFLSVGTPFLTYHTNLLLESSLLTLFVGVLPLRPGRHGDRHVKELLQQQ